MQKWVIWGIDKSGDIIFNTRNVIKPSRTKEYKSLEKDFNKGLVKKFGFMSYVEYEKSDYWLDCFNQYKELGNK
tara:strand:- start:194 stop:415 length:222 start_codon:yes stop_codon:yes gene_type:complete